MPKKASSKAGDPFPPLDVMPDEASVSAEQKWDGPSETDSSAESTFDRKRNLMRVLQTIGTADGDTELPADVKSPLTPDNYLDAARLLHSSGRHDESLRVAELGVESFRNHPGLTAILVDEYLHAGRKREALDAAWSLFSAAPDMEAFALLKKSATARRVWKTWKQKALELLEEQCEQQAEQSGETQAPPTASSLLVEILLIEGDDDAAWETATTYGCSDDIWLRLAAARADRNPEDALAIYRAQIEQATKSVSWRAYERVIELLRLMEPVFRSQGRSDEFLAEVEALRATWDGRRKNLVWMLGEAFPGGKKKAKP